jgi:hypothetical protein
MLCGKFIRDCGLRINTANGFTGFAAELYMLLKQWKQNYTSRYHCYSRKLQGEIKVVAELYIPLQMC